MMFPENSMHQGRFRNLDLNLLRVFDEVMASEGAVNLAGANKADALVLEVGMGGGWDATNVVTHPRATAITPVDATGT